MPNNTYCQQHLPTTLTANNICQQHLLPTQPYVKTSDKKACSSVEAKVVLADGRHAEWHTAARPHRSATQPVCTCACVRVCLYARTHVQVHVVRTRACVRSLDTHAHMHVCACTRGLSHACVRACVRTFPDPSSSEKSLPVRKRVQPSHREPNLGRCGTKVMFGTKAVLAPK